MAETLNGGKVIQIYAPSGSQSPSIKSVKIATAAGAAPVEMTVALGDGRTINLLGKRSVAEIEKHFQALNMSDPYASNVFFQPGVAAALYPFANRLTGVEPEDEVISANVMGVPVRMPVNHGRGTGQRRHHLHGLLFDQPAHQQECSHSEYRAVFGAAFAGEFWTGHSEVRIHERLTERGFEFEMEAMNVGDTIVPAGGGAHPYFIAPSGNPAAVKLVIPGRQLVEIDNYENVLPTGRILPVLADMDFNKRDGVALRGRYLDNLWVDLETDNDGYAYCELIDTEAKLRVRMTATTKNIIGIQCYSPKPESKPELGVFAALELVTNLPDPREDLWKDTPTGMVLLQPGEKFRYGYRIEVFSL